MDKKNKILIFALAFGVFGLLNTEMGIIGILPLLAQKFSVEISSAGLLVSLFSLAVAISGPILPIVFSKFNRKRVLLLTLGIFILGNLISSVTNNFVILLIARILPAFLHPVYISLALTMASNSVPESQVPKAVSRVILGVSAGMVIGIPITSYIASAFSLSVAMLYLSVVNIVAFVLVSLLVTNEENIQTVSYSGQFEVLKQKQIWIAIIGVIFIGSAMFSVYSYLSEFLTQITNVHGNEISIGFIFFGFASIVGNLLGGKLLTDRPKRTIVAYPIILSLTYLAITFTGASYLTMLFMMFIFGILFSIGNNICQYWIFSSARKAPELANGLFLTAGNLGVTIGTTVSGIFIVQQGPSVMTYIGIAFLIISGFFIFFRSEK